MIDIPGYEGKYKIDIEKQSVFSVKRNRYLKGGFTKGYHRFGLMKNGKRKFHFIHRLIYQAHHGELPPVIDHIDGNPSNNSIDNLRCATVAQNQWNTKLKSNNTTGFKGVSFDKWNNRYRVEIKANGKLHSTSWKDIGDAKMYLELAREMLHGDFACNGHRK